MMANTYRIGETGTRPWGDWTIVDTGPVYAVKRIRVSPGERLSLQRHRWRDEHWVVVAGTALIEIDGATKQLKANESVFVHAGSTHRLSNPETTDLVVVEIQFGENLAEDDIERIEDKYGRS